MNARTFIGLLCFKTKMGIKAETARYYLNYLWWAIEPLLTMAVFYIVFEIFMNKGTSHYIAFLLCGLLCWQWFQRSVNNSATSILGGRWLMLQVDIHKIFFPMEVILRDLFKQFFVLILLLVFLCFYPTPVGITWLALPVLLVVQLLLNAAVSILCAAIIPFVPDLKFVISSLLQLMFFGSGIFYDMDKVVLAKHRFIMYLNPIAGLIKNYREVLMRGHWPDWTYLFYVFLFALVLLSFAIYLLNRFNRIYPRICQL